MRAIRQAMGIKQRYFVLQDVRRFLARNPDFIRQHSPKPKGLPSYRELLLCAVMELINRYDLIQRPVRMQRCAELIGQIEDKLKLSPQIQTRVKSGLDCFR